MARADADANDGGSPESLATLIEQAAARAADVVAERLRRNPLPAPEWISLQSTAAYTGYSEAQMAAFVAEKIAPPSVLFSRNARRFKRSDVDKWCAAGGPSQFRGGAK